MRDLTGGRGADVILDVVGRGLPPAEPRGAGSGRASGPDCDGAARFGQIDLATLLRNRLTITGSTLRARSVEEKGAIAQALRQHVWPLIESGKVAPVVYATYPLQEAAAAHHVMEADLHIGKIVLVAGGSAGDLEQG